MLSLWKSKTNKFHWLELMCKNSIIMCFEMNILLDRELSNTIKTTKATGLPIPFWKASYSSLSTVFILVNFLTEFNREGPKKFYTALEFRRPNFPSCERIGRHFILLLISWMPTRLKVTDLFVKHRGFFGRSVFQIQRFNSGSNLISFSRDHSSITNSCQSRLNFFCQSLSVLRIAKQSPKSPKKFENPR